MNGKISHHGQLANQVAVVTGGSGGIGRAVCLAFAREGAAVVAVDINRAGVEEVTASIREHDLHADPLGLALDVSKEQDMEEMARQTVARFGRIDILVACAGILRGRGSFPKTMVDLSAEEWDEVLNINLKGVFLSNRAVLPTMIRQRRGNIINISSTSGRQGRAHDSAYSASKFGVIGLSEAVAEEVRQFGVRVQVILPDAVDTPMWGQNGPVRPVQPLHPQRVADLILYLVNLPEDTVVLSPIIAPFRTRRRTRPSGSIGEGE
jgi:NAD(P)-dependent dehydrogenase (short-subunit alcohol dehydrogenase family)